MLTFFPLAELVVPLFIVSFLSWIPRILRSVAWCSSGISALVQSLTV